ncbi:MAG: efflux RND transporter periplasmic adaptor subunit [Aureliella sp.]
MKASTFKWLFIALAVVAMGWAAFQTREHWGKLLVGTSADAASEKASPPIEGAKVLKLTPQARKNLGLVSKPAKPQTYWRTVQIPGVITDRPGISDRGVTSPTVGVVTEIHAYPGDTVQPGKALFMLRPFSEYLQNTQTELFKAHRESELIAEQRTRLQGAARNGAISESRLIELDNQARRQAALIQSYQQDLLTRGLSQEQIAAVADGRFVSTIQIAAPAFSQSAVKRETTLTSTGPASTYVSEYEVQELSVELGQQVQAGQLLATLANHRELYIEGHAFKKEATLLAQAAQNATEVNVEFTEDNREKWPAQVGPLTIRHLANTIDPLSRTFSFFVPLENQSQAYTQDGETFVVWRFRPGQRVRLHVPVEELQDVIVLPSAAVVREGPEAYVFQQNGDLFNRLPVHLLYEDRLNVVIANDGSITPGLYLAQNSAASLNRVLKAQAASGVRADVHVHADGTVHAAH